MNTRLNSLSYIRCGKVYQHISLSTYCNNRTNEDSYSNKKIDKKYFKKIKLLEMVYHEDKTLSENDKI